MHLHQEIQKKQMPFGLTIIGIFCGFLLLNVFFMIIQLLPAEIHSIVSVLGIGTLLVVIYNMVYYQMAHYVYHYVDDNYVFERVVGRSNHAVIVVQPKDIISCNLYTGKGVKRRNFFCHKDKALSIYCLTYKSNAVARQIAFCPNIEFLEEIQGQLLK